MSGNGTVLARRRDDLVARWQRCRKQSDMDAFVEFAVAASSFAGYLDANGYAGLHQHARGLEQLVLSQFESWPGVGVSEGPGAELDAHVQALARRIDGFDASNSGASPDRRLNAGSASSWSAGKRVDLVTQNPGYWQDLVTQAGYFNIRVRVWSQPPQEPVEDEPQVLLIDADGLEPTAFIVRVQALRGHFATSTVLGVRVEPGFEAIKRTLRSGCDGCIVAGTPLPVVMARILKLCGHDDETPYRVLVVEDSKVAATLIRRTLREVDIESEIVNRPQDVLAGVQRYQPDLILMDMYMPGCTGVEVTQVLRQQEEFLSTPVVYLSGETSVPLQVDALRLGGDHFLTKPFNPVVLNAVVQSKIARYRLLRRAMTMDSLTGLLNHTTTKQRLDAALRQAQTGGTRLCLAMVDIDHFKRVNDTHGHPMGDQVIRCLAWLLKQRLRKNDLVGRYGGEEFMVVLPEAESVLALQVLERIRIDFSQLQYPLPSDRFACTFSCGVAQWEPGMDAATLLQRADQALYQAKHEGRNRTVRAHG